MINLYLTTIIETYRHLHTMGSGSARTSSDEGNPNVTDGRDTEGDGLVTYYTVLQVEESALSGEGALFLWNLDSPSVRKAYLRLALLCHPDRTGNSEALTFRTIKGKVKQLLGR